MEGRIKEPGRLAKVDPVKELTAEISAVVELHSLGAVSKKECAA